MPLRNLLTLVHHNLFELPVSQHLTCLSYMCPTTLHVWTPCMKLIYRVTTCLKYMCITASVLIFKGQNQQWWQKPSSFTMASKGSKSSSKPSARAQNKNATATTSSGKNTSRNHHSPGNKRKRPQDSTTDDGSGCQYDDVQGLCRRWDTCRTMGTRSSWW